jgi:hypothetical protein
MASVLASHQSASRGCAHCGTRVALREQAAIGGHLIQPRSLDVLLAVTAKIVLPKIIRHYENNVRFRSILRVAQARHEAENNCHAPSDTMLHNIYPPGKNVAGHSTDSEQIAVPKDKLAAASQISSGGGIQSNILNSQATEGITYSSAQSRTRFSLL